MEAVEAFGDLQCVLVHIAMFVDLNHQRSVLTSGFDRLGVGERTVDGYPVMMVLEELFRQFQHLVGWLGFVFVVAQADIHILILVRVGAKDIVLFAERMAIEQQRMAREMLVGLIESQRQAILMIVIQRHGLIVGHLPSVPVDEMIHVVANAKALGFERIVYHALDIAEQTRIGEGYVLNNVVERESTADRILHLVEAEQFVRVMVGEQAIVRGNRFAKQATRFGASLRCQR